MFAGSGLLLAYYLGQFKAYENRFIHITQADTVESAADYSAHPRALQSAHWDCISNRCWKKSDCLKKMFAPAGPATISKSTSTRGTNTGRKKGSSGRGTTTTYVASRMSQNYPPCRRTSTLLTQKKKRKKKTPPSKIYMIFDFGEGVCESNGASSPC